MLAGLPVVDAGNSREPPAASDRHGCFRKSDCYTAYERNQTSSQRLGVATRFANNYEKVGQSLTRMPFPNWYGSIPKGPKCAHQIIGRSKDHKLLKISEMPIDRPSMLCRQLISSRLLSNVVSDDYCE